MTRKSVKLEEKETRLRSVLHVGERDLEIYRFNQSVCVNVRASIREENLRGAEQRFRSTRNMSRPMIDAHKIGEENREASQN